MRIYLSIADETEVFWTSTEPLLYSALMGETETPESEIIGHILLGRDLKRYLRNIPLTLVHAETTFSNLS